MVAACDEDMQLEDGEWCEGPVSSYCDIVHEYQQVQCACDELSDAEVMELQRHVRAERGASRCCQGT